VGGADSRPTDQAYQVYKILSAQLDVQLRALHSALGELKGVNTFLASHGAAAIVPSTAEVKGADVPAPDEGETDMDDSADR
jgi:hypothetical protein